MVGGGHAAIVDTGRSRAGTQAGIELSQNAAPIVTLTSLAFDELLIYHW